jgi:hypothetical protein
VVSSSWRFGSFYVGTVITEQIETELVLVIRLGAYIQVIFVHTATEIGTEATITHNSYELKNILISFYVEQIK